MKKSEHFGNFWFKKKTGKCQKHETNMILCLLHATDIYQFFLENFTHKHFTSFKKKVEQMKNKVNILVIFGSKKKLVNVRSMKQTRYYVCCMLLAFASIFFENFTHKH